MFYTYVHTTPKGIPFYVGKGTGSRCFSKGDRSYQWKQMVDANQGIAAYIASHWNTENEAFQHEKFLISCFKDMGYKLVNKTAGGRGANESYRSPETRAKLKSALTGIVHKIITCPHCGTSGGATSIRRWHFDNCTGAKIFKARVTIDGKRKFLGNYATFDEATDAMKKAYIDNGKPLPKEFVSSRKLKNNTI